ncbi:MAG: M15 family metallopeptidase [Patescibacteria group bacterium]|nr:M15 family metallopeptidase [Patescibacteria group bacterium]MCL5224221.1 M15 family metallopeptidase [Patescibacteria group bacterium]
MVAGKKLPKGKWTYYVVAVLAVVVAVVFFTWKKVVAVPIPTGLDPNFINQVNKCFIPTAAVYGYDLRITSGFRTLAQQQQIYDQGRLEDGEVVTEAPPGHSLHNYGFAVDVADRIRGYNIDWQELIAIGAYCGLGNGGVGDYPHFEYRGGLTTDEFAAGMRPKPLTLPCPIMAARAKENRPLTLKDLQSCGAPDFSKAG